MATASEIPLRLSQGETAQWTRRFPDHPSDAWAIRYEIRGPAAVTVTGTFAVSGTTEWDFELVAMDAATLVPGVYDFEVYAAGDPDRLEVLDRGELEVLPSLADATAGEIDATSHARRMLDAIEARLEGRVVSDHESYSKLDRAVQRIPFEQLSAERRRYQREVQREERREARKRGDRRAGMVVVGMP